MSAQPQRSSFDIGKITGPFPLLGAFLLIIEGLLGFWLYVAQSVAERIAAGSLMTVIFLVFLFVVLRLGTKEPAKVISPEGLGEVTPAKEQITEKQIESLAPDDRFVAPDGSFTISTPPHDWIVREIAINDWRAEALGISDPALRQTLVEDSSQDGQVFIFESKRRFSVITLPGKTLIDGRKFPAADNMEVPFRLTVLPMDRAQPPLFIERPLEHNFVTQVAGILSIGVVTLQSIESGTVQNSKLRYWTAECRQNLQNVLIDGVEGSVTTNLFVMAIEGELRDHLLMMNYPSMSTTADSVIEQNHATLKSLVNSFRPLKILNPEKRREEIRRLADKKFDEFMARSGTPLFWVQLGAAGLRLSGQDLNDAETRLRAMRMLKPLQELAKELNIQDEDLNELWTSLEEAEGGDATKFKAKIEELTKALSDGLKSNATEATAIDIEGSDQKEPEIKALKGKP